MSNAFKVGLFAAVTLLVLAAMVLRIEEVRLFGGPERTLVAVFDSIAGLDDKSAVRIAGVRVGRVDGITLVERKARVRLVLEREEELTEGTVARIANMGLLGDKYVVLDPGPEGAPPLAEGAAIPGSTPPTFDEALAKFNELGDTLGTLGGTLTGTGGDTPMDRLIRNLDAMSSELRAMVEQNRSRVDSTFANSAEVSATLARELPRLTRQMGSVLDRVDRTLLELQGAVEQGRPDLEASLENVRRLTDRAQESVDNLNEVTGRMARGEGTIGKLLSSEEAHDELVGALGSVESGVESLQEAFGSVQKIQLDLGLESYYLEARDESRSSFNLDVDTRSGGPLYRVGVVDSPGGKTETEIDRITVIRPDGSRETTVRETVEQKDELTFSAMVGFRLFERSRFWAGMIESSGGVQVEQPFLDRRLLLSLEAFDFDRPGDLDPHLRLSGRWRLNERLYLKAGYDDFLTDERRGLFVGGGITWRDDTLKYLMGSLPRF